MKYKIRYSVACHQGKVREINQDNFSANGKSLDIENTGLDSPIFEEVSIREAPIFAVFDGMGGEQKGEVASFTAAKTLNALQLEDNNQNETEFLRKICSAINSEICRTADELRISTTGTTGAIILFAKKQVYICNIGDSPIFRFDEGTIQKISTDHIQENYLNGKPPLTQFLGVPESDFIIQPYIAKGSYKLGNKYLLCSDGLTDMVDIDTIKKIVDSSSTEIATQSLLDVALENGGKDNITIILCEIIKDKILFNFSRKDDKQ